STRVDAACARRHGVRLARRALVDVGGLVLRLESATDMSESGLTRRSALAAAGVAGVGAVAGYAAGRKTDAAQASPPASTGDVGRRARRPGAVTAATGPGDHPHGRGVPRMRLWLRIPTVLWLLAAGFAVGVLIALR